MRSRTQKCNHISYVFQYQKSVNIITTFNQFDLMITINIAIKTKTS